MVTEDQVGRAALAGGWSLVATERVLRMAAMLSDLARHPDLGQLALKGGTALNAFEWEMPRLSVDLDFNLVGVDTRADVEARLPQIDQALADVAQRHGMTATRVRSAPGGTKWRHGYRSEFGTSGNVEVDVNLSYRSPLPPTRRCSTSVLGEVDVHEVLVMSHPELGAGKLMALLDRTRGRDVFDSLRLLEGSAADPLLRTCFIVYAAGVRRPWRELLATPITADAREVGRMVVPMLRFDERPADVTEWSADQCARVEELLGPLRTVTPHEESFLDAIALRGEIDPTLLGIEDSDPMAAAIRSSPVLQWKAQHVRGHFR